MSKHKPACNDYKTSHDESDHNISPLTSLTLLSFSIFFPKAHARALRSPHSQSWVNPLSKDGKQIMHASCLWKIQPIRSSHVRRWCTCSTITHSFCQSLYGTPESSNQKPTHRLIVHRERSFALPVNDGDRYVESKHTSSWPEREDESQR